MARFKFESENVKKGVRTTFGQFDGHSMSKKCMPLWREAHLEGKCGKILGFSPYFDVSDVVLLTGRWI